MAEKDLIIMSHRESNRLYVIRQTIDKVITQDHTAVVQRDGSYHDKFEGQGPWCVLMGYVDDATGTVSARLYEYEGTLPARDGFKRYSKEAVQEADFHRPVVIKRGLDTILSIKTDRAQRNDFTIAHNKKLYQIRSNIRAKTVTVEERTDGTMRIICNSQQLRYHETVARPFRTERSAEKPRPRGAPKPSESPPGKSPAKSMVKARTELQAAN